MYVYAVYSRRAPFSAREENLKGSGGFLAAVAVREETISPDTWVDMCIVRGAGEFSRLRREGGIESVETR